MARYFAVAAVGCVYVFVVSWAVRREGERYRASLKPKPLEAASGEKPDSPRAPSDASLKDPADDRVDVKAGAPVNPGRSGSRDPGVAERGASAVPPPVPIRNPGKPEADIHPIWNDPIVVRKWDLDTITADLELQLGSQIHELIKTLNDFDESGEFRHQVLDAAETLLESRPRKDLDYTFTVLASDEVNAFSHPGGYIYVSRGLLKFLDGDAAGLEFVLAHEMAHIELGHALTALRQPKVKNIPLGTIATVYLVIIPHAFPDNWEYRADDWAATEDARGRSEPAQGFEFPAEVLEARRWPELPGRSINRAGVEGRPEQSPEG